MRNSLFSSRCSLHSVFFVIECLINCFTIIIFDLLHAAPLAHGDERKNSVTLTFYCFFYRVFLRRERLLDLFWSSNFIKAHIKVFKSFFCSAFISICLHHHQCNNRWQYRISSYHVYLFICTCMCTRLSSSLHQDWLASKFSDGVFTRKILFPAHSIDIKVYLMKKAWRRWQKRNAKQ